MNSIPLHPAVVHLPLGIAMILPLLAIGMSVAIWRGWFPSKVWGIVAFLHLLLFATTILALKTGEREEEKVEEVVQETALEAHEEKAEVFLWVTGMTMVLSGSALFLRKRNLGLAVRLAATLGLGAVATLALSVGHSGGDLVYRQGAASAYSAGFLGNGQMGGNEVYKNTIHTGEKGVDED